MQYNKIYGSGISCIYKITNVVTGEFYIGQTNNLNVRHKAEQNYRNCTHLYRDIKKYGWNSFIKTAVEYCHPSKLDDLEYHYIQTLQPPYNIRGTDGDDINSIANITKGRMSESKINDARVNRKAVINLTTNQVYDSITAAAESVGTDKIGISRACKGTTKTCKGFKWAFV